VDRKSVVSSNIVSVGYDPEKQDMEVEFKGGSTYTYHGVSELDYKDFINAESIGSHFHQKVRNEFKFTKGGAV